MITDKQLRAMFLNELVWYKLPAGNYQVDWTSLGWPTATGSKVIKIDKKEPNEIDLRR